MPVRRVFVCLFVYVCICHIICALVIICAIMSVCMHVVFVRACLHVCVCVLMHSSYGCVRMGCMCMCL